jgi:hypothetical protein
MPEHRDGRTTLAWGRYLSRKWGGLTWNEYQINETAWTSAAGAGFETTPPSPSYNPDEAEQASTGRADVEDGDDIPF